ncbi:MAG: squalene/phytoene synthase family protein [Betaproteobacteria bacterium]|nr:squalene/phytoene synthase family protein [Betaproteobacteria bacterium]
MFVALSRQIQAFQLPTQLLHDLVPAFEQDISCTAQVHRYADEAELLDYCRLLAVEASLLHLYKINDQASLAHSDHICGALQLINFYPADLSGISPINISPWMPA